MYYVYSETSVRSVHFFNVVCQLCAFNIKPSANPKHKHLFMQQGHRKVNSDPFIYI